MSNEQSVRVITPMPKALLREIDKYRFKQECASRSEAIRRLLQQALRSQRAVKSV